MRYKYSTPRFAPLLVFSLLLIVPFTFQQSDPPNQSSQNLPLGPSVTNLAPPYVQEHSLSKGQPSFFKIDLSNRKQDFGLSVSVTTSEGQAPKVYFSQWFDLTLNTTLQGDLLPNGTILVPPDQFGESKTAYVQLECEIDECKANVAIEYSKEIYMEANGRFYDEWPEELEGASKVVVKLYVPPRDDATRLVINAEVILTKIGPEPYVQLHAIKEETESHQAEEISDLSWFEGKTLALNHDSKFFCTDCNYTISLNISQHSAVRLQATVFGETTEIWRRRFTDAVSEEGLSMYSLNIEQKLEKEDILIFVNLLSGSLTVYIQCDYLPKELSGYRWKHVIRRPEDIILGSREMKSCSTQIFNIAVYGNEKSLYTIAAHIKGTGHLSLGTDVPLTGQLLPGEHLDEEFVVPLDILEKLEIELETHSKVNISLINCRFPTDCPGLRLSRATSVSNYEHPNIDATPFQYDIVDTGRGKKLSVEPHSNGCYPILIMENVGFMHPVCAYMIRLVSEDISKADYTLKIELEGHQVLLPAVPKMGTIFEDDKLYYVFSVPHPKVKEVSFQLTLISGDAVLFVSRIEEYPDQKSPNAKLAFEGRSVFKDDPNLNGTYYLTVQGYQAGSFILTGSILGADGKPEDYALELQEGISQKGVLFPKHENPMLFYKIKVDLPEDWEGELKIATVPWRGTVMLIANNKEGEMPNIDQEKWNTIFNYLRIKSTDEDFIRKGVYHVGVFVDWSDPNALVLEDITFTISYLLVGQRRSKQPEEPVEEVTEGGTENGENSEEEPELEPELEPEPEPEPEQTHMVLTEQFPYHGTIKDGEIQFYKVFVHTNDEFITIYKDADYGNIELYVSVNPENKYPDGKKYDYSTKNMNKGLVRLTKQDLDKACENVTTTNTKSKPNCEIYLSVMKDLAGRENPPELGDEKEGKGGEIGYTLRVQLEKKSQDISKRSLIPLENGLEYEFELPEDGETRQFYFYPYPGMDIHLVVSSYFKNPIIYVNVKEYHVESEREEQDKSQLVVPTEENHNFSSITNGNSEGGFGYVMIPGGLSVPTVVVVAIYFKPITSKHTITEPSKANTQTFSILVSLANNQIVSGKTYPGTVEEKAYVHYEIDVKKPDCTLLIVLTSLDGGDANLVVSYDPEIVPTLALNQFAAVTKQTAEMLEIGPDNIYPKSDMQGKWIIGVYGRTKASYTLTVAYEDQKMIEIRPGFPLELYLKAGSTLNLKYSHEVGGNFFLRIDKQSGDLFAYIKTMRQYTDLAASLPSSSNYTWKMKPEEHSKLRIDNEHPVFCDNCIYLIALEALKATKLIFSVFEEGSMNRVQRSLNYYDTIEAGKSDWYFFSANYIEEVILNLRITNGRLGIYASHNPSVNSSNFIWSQKLSSDQPNAIIKMKNADYLAVLPQQQSVWDGNMTVSSLDNVFYLLFVNEAQDLAQFTFTIEDKVSSTVLMLDKSYHSVFESYKARSFLYYSPFKNEILVLNTRYCFRTLVEESAFLKLQVLKTEVKFWEQEVTAGMGMKIKVNSNFLLDHFEDEEGKEFKKVCIMQTDRFEGDKKEGRYEISFENPYPYELDAKIYIHTTKTEVRKFEQNEAYFGIMEHGQKSIYSLYSSNGQTWYFDMLVCTGSVKIDLAESEDSLEAAPKLSKELKEGEHFVYTAYNQESGTSFIRLQSLTKENNETQYLLKSNHFAEDSIIKYENLETPPQVEYSYVYSRDKPALEIYHQPVVWKVASEPEQIFYHVKVCPKKENGVHDRCGRRLDCLTANVVGLSNSKELITTRLENVQPGEYSIIVLGSVTHKEKSVYSLLYPEREISVGEPLIKNFDWRTILYILLGLVGLLASLLIYRKIRRAKVRKGIPVPDKEGYGFLGEEVTRE